MIRVGSDGALVDAGPIVVADDPALSYTLGNVASDGQRRSFVTYGNSSLGMSWAVGRIYEQEGCSYHPGRRNGSNSAAWLVAAVLFALSRRKGSAPRGPSRGTRRAGFVRRERRLAAE